MSSPAVAKAPMTAAIAFSAFDVTVSDIDSDSVAFGISTTYWEMLADSLLTSLDSDCDFSVITTGSCTGAAGVCTGMGSDGLVGWFGCGTDSVGASGTEGVTTGASVTGVVSTGELTEGSGSVVSGELVCSSGAGSGCMGATGFGLSVPAK